MLRHCRETTNFSFIGEVLQQLKLRKGLVDTEIAATILSQFSLQEKKITVVASKSS
jgi:hypothetical protein